METDRAGMLFISHAARDHALAARVRDLIRLGTDLSRDRIVCTSADGTGIPEGESNYVEWLRQRLVSSALVVPLLTPTYFTRSFCLLELGASWGLGPAVFPLLVQPAGYADLEELLGKVQAGRLQSPSVLPRLHDRIIQCFDLQAATDDWESQRDDFLDDLPDLLDGLSVPDVVPRTEHERTLRALEELRRALADRDEELEDAKRRLAKMADATSERDARALLVPEDERQRWEHLLSEARDAVAALHRATVYALLAEDADIPFAPSHYEQPDLASSAEQAEQDNELAFHEGDGVYYPIDSEPRVRRARLALEDLFHQGWSDELTTQLKEEFDTQFTSSNRRLWMALDLL